MARMTIDPRVPTRPLFRGVLHQFAFFASLLSGGDNDLAACA